MNPAHSALLLGLAVALAACGGKTSGDDAVAGDDHAPSEREEPAREDEPEGETARPGGTTLGACEPGFDPAREPRRACDWLADDRCYPSKLAACNCVCPRERASTCSSGFFMGSGSRTEVSCF